MLRKIKLLIYRKIKSLLKKDFFINADCEIPNIRLGGLYGGWVISPKYVNADSIIYSFGVGTDISFDIELIDKFSVNVYAFDPTPSSIDWVNSQKITSKFKFYNFGISNSDGYLKFYLPKNESHVSHSVVKSDHLLEKFLEVPVKSITSIMSYLNHNFIDIMKMDIEGAEYEVIDDLIKNKVFPNQLLIEFHHRFNNIGINKSLDSIKKLQSNGYLLFSVSPSGEEFSFIRKELLLY